MGKRSNARLQAHEIEIEAEIRERNIVSCTQDELLAYLESHPSSTLSLLYDLDLPENTPNEIIKVVNRVTALLFRGTIPHPSQTLDELCIYLDETIFQRLPQNPAG